MHFQWPVATEGVGGGAGKTLTLSWHARTCPQVYGGNRIGAEHLFGGLEGHALLSLKDTPACMHVCSFRI